MKRVLITGGFGFIGSHLTKECIRQGHDVTILDKSLDNDWRLKGTEVKFILDDVSHIGASVKKYDWIFHLAGSTDNYAVENGTPFRDIEANCTTTLALLEACRKHNPSVRIVYASTFFVNGKPKFLPVEPKDKCNPLGLYGATKLCAEHFCRIYNDVYGLDIVVARFSNVYGPKEKGDKQKAGFNYMIKQAVDGKDLDVYYDGMFCRDYIYVTDVATALITLAEKGNKEEIYYVGIGGFTVFGQLIEFLTKLTGVEANPIKPPEFHKKIGIKDFACNVTPLRNLGWKPEVMYKSGIKKTIEYYRGTKKELWVCKACGVHLSGKWNHMCLSPKSHPWNDEVTGDNKYVERVK